MEFVRQKIANKIRNGKGRRRRKKEQMEFCLNVVQRLSCFSVPLTPFGFSPIYLFILFFKLQNII